MDWNAISSIATAIGALLSALGLFLVLRQLSYQTKTAKADYLLRLEETFSQHYYPTFKKFDSDGWGDKLSVDEVTEIENYLGFFANFRTLVDEGLLPFDALDRAFAYRFFIGANSLAAQRIVLKKKTYWEDLFHIYNRWVELRRKRGAPIVGDAHLLTDAEQGGADQPATAPESKPDGDSKPQLESEGRAQ